jgi:hypothetical protein
MHRRIEAVRDRIFRGVGTDEPLIEEDMPLLQTRQWRKPLRIDEVNRMADTPEARQRPERA